MSIFEALMLICFGLSGPVSIIKTLRTKTVSGKSPLFIGIIILGYTFGLTHKLLYSRDWVIYLYVYNLVVVSLDLVLYYRYVGGRSPADDINPSTEKVTLIDRN
jgi:hypothetical protein